MKLTFLGTGSAFTLGDGNFQSNLLLQAPSGKNLLIDCGSDARHSMYACGFTFKDVDAVYISHLHSDHVGGLEWLGFSNKFDPENPRKPILFTHQEIVNDLWNTVLSGGLSSLPEETANLSSFFDVRVISEYFEWENVKFFLIKTTHYFSNHKLKPSYGLQFTINDSTVFITTDSSFTPKLFKQQFALADFIFHDCETSLYKTGYHARYEELITLPEEVKKKMWLYHFQPGELPDAKAQGFKGFLKKGQSFDL